MTMERATTTATTDDAPSTDVLLFDLYAGGHHLEYASGLAAELSARAPALDIDFLTAVPTDRESMYFSPDDVDHLYDPGEYEPSVDAFPDREPFDTVASFLGTEVFNPRWEALRDTVEYVQSGSYDLVHVLEIDRIHADALCHLADADTLPIVGSINGRFFKPDPPTLPCRRPVTSLLDGWLRGPLTRYTPRVLREDPEWNHWYLEQCLQADVFDHLLVHSTAAKRSVVDRCPSASPDIVTVVPDPVESWDADGPDPAAARRDLDLPEDDPLILFFGQLREEKGVDLLLDALDGYDGPACTVVFAGSPVAVTAEEIEAVDRRTSATLVPRLEFIPQDDVETYFRAADCVALPYRRSFGDERASGVFQKACAAGRPVIASDFGTFRERVRSWDLGLLFESGSDDSLRAAIERFLDSDAVYDPASMAEYAESQTFERLAMAVGDVYDDVTSRNGRP
jgi:glycosyltransferase involved in cell wall biosynthesis